MTGQPPRPATASLLDYLRLARLPNVFTAAADVAMGYLLVHGSLEPAALFLTLLVASGLLYSAGMVLNDVYDAPIDLQHRPHRPIPSGRISIKRAQSLGYGLLLSGVALGWIAGLAGFVRDAPLWRSGAVASLLALCVVLYDALLKTTPVGPIVMGTCRLLNVLLGMSIADPSYEAWSLGGYALPQLIPAAGIGMYAAGITWFASTEAGQSRRGPLAAAAAVMMAGIAVLAMLHWSYPVPPRANSNSLWPFFVAILAVVILRRCGAAMVDPTPQNVQMAVTHSILSIIVLDAAVTLKVAQWYHALGILVLLIPAIVLGKWISST